MDRNYLLDLALSIAQDCADEWHSRDYIQGLESELESVDEKEMPALHEKLKKQIEEEKEEWLDGVKLRRRKMDVLGIQSPNYDYHKRCTLKHRATAYVEAVETYQASPQDINYVVLVKSEKRFFRALSKFMGMEITDCGRCLSDQLNVEQSKEWAKKNGYQLNVGGTDKS